METTGMGAPFLVRFRYYRRCLGGDRERGHRHVDPPPGRWDGKSRRNGSGNRVVSGRSGMLDPWGM